MTYKVKYIYMRTGLNYN
jgi:hypothetical protein